MIDNGRYRAEDLHDEGLWFFMAGDVHRSPDKAECQECVLPKSIVQLLARQSGSSVITGIPCLIPELALA